MTPAARPGSVRPSPSLPWRGRRLAGDVGRVRPGAHSLSGDERLDRYRNWGSRRAMGDRAAVRHSPWRPGRVSTRAAEPGRRSARRAGPDDGVATQTSAPMRALLDPSVARTSVSATSHRAGHVPIQVAASDVVRAGRPTSRLLLGDPRGARTRTTHAARICRQDGSGRAASSDLIVLSLHLEHLARRARLHGGDCRCARDRHASRTQPSQRGRASSRRMLAGRGRGLVSDAMTEPSIRRPHDRHAQDPDDVPRDDSLLDADTLRIVGLVRPSLRGTGSPASAPADLRGEIINETGTTAPSPPPTPARTGSATSAQRARRPRAPAR